MVHKKGTVLKNIHHYLRIMTDILKIPVVFAYKGDKQDEFFGSPACKNKVFIFDLVHLRCKIFFFSLKKIIGKMPHGLNVS